MRADVMRLRGTNNFRASRPLVTTMVSPRRCTGTGLYSLAGLIIQQHGAPGSNPGMSTNVRGCVVCVIGVKPSTHLLAAGMFKFGGGLLWPSRLSRSIASNGRACSPVATRPANFQAGCSLVTVALDKRLLTRRTKRNAGVFASDNVCRTRTAINWWFDSITACHFQ